MPNEDWQSIAAGYKHALEEVMHLQARSSRERLRQDALIQQLLAQRDYLRKTRTWFWRLVDKFFYPKIKPISDQALLELIALSGLRVANSQGYEAQREATAQLRQYLTPGMHEKDMGNDANLLGERIGLEWYGGQLLLIVEEQDPQALSTWMGILPRYNKE